MKKKAKPKKENSERWLLTYSDLITLLMILFILLYAMSTVDQAKFQELTASLSGSMGNGSGIFSGSNGVLPGGGNENLIGIVNEGETQSDQEEAKVTETPTDAPEVTKAPDDSQGTGDIEGSLDSEEDMADFEKYINEILKDMNIELSADTAMIDRGLIISFKNDIFFDSGKDILKNDMKKGLKKIAVLLNKVDNPIVIEGHTDNIPISVTNKYSSNWQLSAARAANVAQYLVENEKVDGKRISAIGYGEYRPIASNNTIAGRSKNRRVDIIILYDQEG